MTWAFKSFEKVDHSIGGMKRFVDEVGLRRFRLFGCELGGCGGCEAKCSLLIGKPFYSTEVSPLRDTFLIVKNILTR